VNKFNKGKGQAPAEFWNERDMDDLNWFNFCLVFSPLPPVVKAQLLINEEE